MDGIEVARLARENLGRKCPLLLMLTSDDIAITRSRMREQGLDACLIKPIRKGELLNLIASAMNGGLSPESTQSAPAAQTAAVNGRAQPKLRILLADDSPDNRMLIKTYLKRMPWHLEMVEDGEQALAKFIGNEYDVVLMDIQMPVMDGYDATRKIRQWESEQGRAATPVIALTAAALKEDEVKSLEAGCDLHVTKPVKKARLLEAISKAVEGQPNAGQARDDAADASPASAASTPVMP
jgi:CheY-like chemotaxis protein